jgi:hypothetical protein
MKCSFHKLNQILNPLCEPNSARTMTTKQLKTRVFTLAAKGIAVFGVLVDGSPSRALTFNLTYDASTVGAPAGFFTAFQAAIDFYQSAYSDPITINLQVGWGQINGHSLNPGNIGQSSTFQQGYFTYDQIVAAVTSDATSADDATAVASLPATDPTGGASFVMANAEAKALGLLAANATGLDGYVGFSSTAAFNFDTANRAVSGKYDFFGLACHEITEIMGRYGLGQNGASSGRYSPIDLFRYSSAGNLDLIPANGAYLSIDDGNSIINTFNGTSGGDLSDWSGLTFDAFNNNLTAGHAMLVSAGDMTEMDIIGYDLAPGSPTLMITSMGPTSVVLSWTSPVPGFVIQTNGDLTTVNWQPANYNISTSNATNYSTAIDPLPPGTLFFRLAHP